MLSRNNCSDWEASPGTQATCRAWWACWACFYQHHVVCIKKRPLASLLLQPPKLAAPASCLRPVGITQAPGCRPAPWIQSWPPHLFPAKTGWHHQEAHLDACWGGGGYFCFQEPLFSTCKWSVQSIITSEISSSASSVSVVKSEKYWFFYWK